jgi:hypothetical protein
LRSQANNTGTAGSFRTRRCSGSSTAPRRDTLAFQIDLWSARPTDLLLAPLQGLRVFSPQYGGALARRLPRRPAHAAPPEILLERPTNHESVFTFDLASMDVNRETDEVNTHRTVLLKTHCKYSDLILWSGTNDSAQIGVGSHVETPGSGQRQRIGCRFYVLADMTARKDGHRLSGWISQPSQSTRP